ncbi:hypothetical protein [Flavobacterium sp. FlaQc-48]|uniref:hypothetical protein n=1 Tax=Flavobacterium sp. FlaQc-48 TaxID=3374181 RepID=UPI0037572592
MILGNIEFSKLPTIQLLKAVNFGRRTNPWPNMLMAMARRTNKKDVVSIFCMILYYKVEKNTFS